MRLRLLLFASLSLALSAQDADAIIAKNLQARGGAARLASITGLRLIGRTALIPDIKRVPWMEEDRFPHAWRKETRLDGGLTEIDTFDGKQGWELIPWAANKDPRPIRPEAIRYLQDEERFWDLLLTYKARGLKAEYLGKVSVGEGPMHKVRIQMTPACEVDYYFDPSTFQERQRDQIWREMGEEAKMQSTFDEFHVIDGVVLPFFIERRAVGRGARERLIVEGAELSPRLEDGRFGKPAR